MPHFDDLVSADFKIREKVQESMVPWIAHDPEFAKSTLLDIYRQASNPELRVRLFYLIERAYFPPTRGFLGITLRTSVDQSDGIVVTSVLPGSQAEFHGILPDDLIMKIGLWQAKYAPDLDRQFITQVTSYAPGSVIPMTILRGEETINLDFRFGIFPTPSEQIKSAAGAPNREILQQFDQFRAWFEHAVRDDQKTT